VEPRSEDVLFEWPASNVTLITYVRTYYEQVIPPTMAGISIISVCVRTLRQVRFVCTWQWSWCPRRSFIHSLKKKFDSVRAYACFDAKKVTKSLLLMIVRALGLCVYSFVSRLLRILWSSHLVGVYLIIDWTTWWIHIHTLVSDTTRYSYLFSRFILCMYALWKNIAAGHHKRASKACT